MGSYKTYKRIKTVNMTGFFNLWFIKI